MSIFVCMLAGGVLGWVGCSFLGFNEARGKMAQRSWPSAIWSTT